MYENEGDHYLWGSTKPLGRQYHYQKETRNNSGEDSYTYKETGSVGTEDNWIKIPVYWREWGTEEGWNDLDLEDDEDYIPFYDMSLFGSNLKDIGGTKYDAATANWGGSWRMPSQAQCQELIDNCTVEHLLTGSYQEPVNFVLTGPNGNRILIPSYSYRHEYSSCQDERHGYRLTNEKHWYETNLWTSDASRVKHLLLRYIYDWYDPCYYATEGGGLMHEYPQPQITEKSEQSMYPKNMDAPLVVRPVLHK